PPLRAATAGRPGRVALVDALEAEHAVIEPLLAAIDAAAADPDYGYQRFGDTIDELSAQLTVHLAHEEADGLPLIDASLTPQQWQHFAQVHGERNLPDAPTYLPWLLTGATRQTLDTVLGRFPPPLLAAYRQHWARPTPPCRSGPPTASRREPAPRQSAPHRRQSRPRPRTDEMTMKRIHPPRPRPRPERIGQPALPPDPWDRDIVRARTLAR